MNAVVSPPPAAPHSPRAADELWRESADEGVEHDTCPLCQGRRLHYAFSTAERRVVRCAECRLVLLNPRPAGAREPAAAVPCIGTGTSPAAAECPADLAGSDRDRESLVAATARYQLAQLARYRGQEGGALLVIDAGPCALAAEAAARGYDVTQVRLRSPRPFAPPATARGPGRALICTSVEAAGLAPGSFDVCALTGALESAADPLSLLRSARRLLKPDGVLLVVTPSLDALSGRPGGTNGTDRGSVSGVTGATGVAGVTAAPGRAAPVARGRLTWFDFNTIQSALHQTGFEQAVVQSRRRARPLPGGGMVALARSAARPAAPPACRTLSVVVPAYNEAATVGGLLDALLGKRLPGMRIEVIVVESNSTDGTRDVVSRYADHPRVRLVLEERPRGKGHAVRTGLAHATGDYVLIQDADLEYDLEDYDVLLEPLAAGREALVLGSRHGGNAWWKMRRFTGQPVASLALNCGHWFFTALLNLLFRQRLKDPFTMYKVFRRDCLFGLEFRCDRFDFDYELLVKLIRKGYNPVEIPVNYRSRSFKEGKKVSVLRDPFNWLRALAWLRFVRVDPMAEIERRRGTAAQPAAAPAAELPSRAAA